MHDYGLAGAVGAPLLRDAKRRSDSEAVGTALAAPGRLPTSCMKMLVYSVSRLPPNQDTITFLLVSSAVRVNIVAIS